MVGRDRDARPERAREPRPARMLGQVDEEVVAPRAQLPQQAGLGE